MSEIRTFRCDICGSKEISPDAKPPAEWGTFKSSMPDAAISVRHWCKSCKEFTVPTGPIAEVALNAEQKSNLDKATAELDASEERLKELRCAEPCFVATAADYAAFDAALKAEQVKFYRFSWIAHILRAGKDLAWQN